MLRRVTTPARLAAWLRLSINGRPHAPSTSDLERWVAEGVASANGDAELSQKAAEQIVAKELRKLTLGQLDSNKDVIQAMKQAAAKVAAEPDVFQQGKARADHVLAYVRGKLHPSLQNRVRSDVADVVRYAPSPSVLSAPALIPPEIEELLRYLAG
jgi:hypothetical protein